MIEQTDGNATMTRDGVQRPRLSYTPGEMGASISVRFDNMAAAMDTIGGLLSLVRDISENMADGTGDMSADASIGVGAVHDLLAKSVEALADLVERKS